MTAAELAQAFRDAGDHKTAVAMGVAMFSRAWGSKHSETAALAIAEARIREMWAKRGQLTWNYTRHFCGDHHLRLYLPESMQKASYLFAGDTLSDCLHAALQAALETTDGE